MAIDVLEGIGPDSDRQRLLCRLRGARLTFPGQHARHVDFQRDYGDTSVDGRSDPKRSAGAGGDKIRLANLSLGGH